MAEILNIGFIGGALNSSVGMTHRIAVEMDKRWQLKAGCFSNNKDENLKTGKACNIDENRIYHNLQQLLISEKGHLDAISVITPPSSHKNITIEAMKAGFAVICEKPLACSSKDVTEIRQIIERHQTFLAVVYNYSGYPMLRELRFMIDKGMLGRVHQIHVEMPQDGYIRLDENGNPSRPQPWRLEDLPDLPTLSLDLGVHLHHMVFFLTGERPIEVTAIQDSFGLYKQVTDTVMCLARYTGDLQCTIWYTKSALGHRNGLRVRVYGTKGSAEWHQMDSETLRYCDEQGRLSLLDRAYSTTFLPAQERYNRFKAGHPSGFIEAFANYYFDVAESLIEFKTKGSYASPWVFGLDIAEEGLRLMEAITRSSRSKSWEPI